MGEGRRDKDVASSKKPNWCKNRYPIYDQNGGKMAKIDTQFMTKTAEKPYLLGPMHKWLTIKNSFVSIKISPTNLVFKLIIQKNFYSQTRLVGLI